MSSATPPADVSEANTTSIAGEIKSWVGELRDQLRSRGTGAQDSPGEPLPAVPAQLKAQRDAVLARLRARLAERPAAEVQADPSGAQIVLACLLGMVDMYADVIADILADGWLISEIDTIASEKYAGKPHVINEVDPHPDYWYQRSDGPGKHDWSDGDNYLRLTLPAGAPASAYQNAEIYNNPRTHIEPRNIIIDPVPPDDPSSKIKQEQRNYRTDWLLNLPYLPADRVVFEARIRAENLKGGSRGWGFWNMALSPTSMQIAWFAQYDGVDTGAGEPIVPSGFYVETQNGLSGLDRIMYRLPDLDEDWHDYRIELNQGSIFYFMDGELVHQVWGASVPSSALQFHCWVDNAVFGIGGTGITHICQHTDAPRSNVVESIGFFSRPPLQPAPAAPVHSIR